MPLLGVSSAVMFVPSLLWLLERAPGLGRTTLMAAFHGAGSLGFLAGTLACGELIRHAGEQGGGYALAFAVAGLSEVLGAGLVVAAVRRPEAHQPPGARPPG
jgi:MFS family permease